MEAQPALITCLIYTGNLKPGRYIRHSALLCVAARYISLLTIQCVVEGDCALLTVTVRCCEAEALFDLQSPADIPTYDICLRCDLRRSVKLNLTILSRVDGTAMGDSLIVTRVTINAFNQLNGEDQFQL